MDEQNSSGRHKLRFFSESVGNGVAGGFLIGPSWIKAATVNGDDDADATSDSALFGGIILTLTIPLNMLVGLIAGTIHGAARTIARSPITPTEQTQLNEKITQLNNYDQAKNQIIANVRAEYLRTKTSSCSDSSTDLIDCLESVRHSDQQKWDALVKYMTENKEGHNKNNGKRLFLIIKAEIDATPLGNVYRP